MPLRIPSPRSHTFFPVENTSKCSPAPSPPSSPPPSHCYLFGFTLQVLCRQPVWGCLLTTCQRTYGFGEKYGVFHTGCSGQWGSRSWGPALFWEAGRTFEAREGRLRASGDSGATRKGWQRPLRDGRIPGTRLGMWACAFVQSFPFPSWVQRKEGWFAAHPEEICRKQRWLLLLLFSLSPSQFFFFFLVNYPRHWNVLMRKSWLREGQEMKSRADFKNNAQFYCAANSQCVFEMKGKEKLLSI